MTRALIVFSVVAAILSHGVIGAVPEGGNGPSLGGQSPDAQRHDELELDLEELLSLMKQRLLLMQDVARAKWNARAPSTDLQREKAMLSALAEKGRSLGLSADLTISFFSAQVDASKILQDDNFRRWEAERQRPFADVADLKRELRPRIDALNAKLLAALAKVRPRLRGREAMIKRLAARALVGDGITSAVREKGLRRY